LPKSVVVWVVVTVEVAVEVGVLDCDEITVDVCEDVCVVVSVVDGDVMEQSLNEPLRKLVMSEFSGSTSTTQLLVTRVPPSVHANPEGVPGNFVNSPTAVLRTAATLLHPVELRIRSRRPSSPVAIGAPLS
jgi:hypothetical protein